jgi:hypothetical protein
MDWKGNLMWQWAEKFPFFFTIVAIVVCLSFAYSIDKLADALALFAPYEYDKDEEETEELKGKQ